ncbi:hypothetical protein ACFUJT_08525 [Streptomyces griseoincarnatus]
MTSPATSPPAPASRVQIACRDLGLLFPTVVLDPLPVWSAPPADHRLPVRTGEGHSLLALRWDGPQDIDGEVLATLDEADNQALHPPVPDAELSRYQDVLDGHLHLTAPPASSILGPWPPSAGLSLLHTGDHP